MSRSTQSLVDRLASEDVFRTASFGVLALRLSGDTLAEYHSQAKLNPASNVKLITTGLALKTLGASARFTSSLAYSGKLSDGILEGDLYIVGGGDPTIGSKDSIVHNEHFKAWKAMLDSANIRSIHGRILGDGRFFDGAPEEPSWQYEDLGTYYGTGGNGLCFYRNIQTFKAVPGKAVGDDISIAPSYPYAPWMTFSYDCKTGAAGTGDNLYLFGTELAPLATIRGTFALDRKYSEVKCSNKFGAFTCASQFRNYLISNGLQVSGSWGDVTEDGHIRCSLTAGTEESMPESLTVIGSGESPDLSKIAYITNQRSDNFYAEALFRLMGRTFGGSASYSSCQDAEKDALKEAGITEGFRLVDGSGLSKKNYASPSFFCNFLKMMMSQDCFESYLATLTQPGKGSQEGRMKGESAGLRERIYWKSGSMDGVRCFSGYIVPEDGSKEDTVVFSVMVNNCTAPSWKIMTSLDSIVIALAKESVSL